ncbi:uncharacterized protein LOC113228882 [Hyposmocoma kahamanoa]|uniref:uncharacterized protein LOC113228882 n=1 Tax=Hyposmocoma kahamanoa TaxID=1477025 RepID=UPI000E6D9761|nr:uncharacterized protein LOC113228882 [Hyposmocoma kahamanoa]
MMNLRNKAFDNYRRTKSDVHKRYYKDLKNLVVSSISAKKSAYFDRLINSQDCSSKMFWKNLKQKILVDPSRTDHLPERFGDPDVINAYFLNLPGSSEVPMSEFEMFSRDRFGEALFKLDTVTEAAVATYILSVKSNAVGSDCISREMILLTLPRTLGVITNIINRSITTGTVPSQRKQALVTPLPKVNNPTELKDLRPISILPFLSKILEKAVYSQLVKFVEANNVLPVLQSEFRKGRGTITALLDVTDNILAEQDSGRGTILTLLDFSRAFDSINISLLLAKLTYYGLNGSAVQWFASYFCARSQAVKLSVSDGSNVVSDFLQTRMNDDLERVAEWSARNALILNPMKSKFIVFGSKKQISNIVDRDPHIEIAGSDVARNRETSVGGTNSSHCGLYWKLPLSSNEMLE